MSTANPYAPPRAAVADVDHPDDDAVQPVKFWSWRGRVGRLRYLSYMMMGYILMIAAAGVLGFVAGALGGKEAGGAIAGSLALIPYFVFVIFQTIQRSHDMDWSGWMSLLAFIPLVGLVWVFKAGTAGGNRFGGPPPPNTLGVKVGALLFPVIAVIGIVAAISIPAYMQYQQKAKATSSK